MPTVTFANVLPFALVALVLGTWVLGASLAGDIPAEQEARPERERNRAGD